MSGDELSRLGQQSLEGLEELFFVGKSITVLVDGSECLESLSLIERNLLSHGFVDLVEEVSELYSSEGSSPVVIKLVEDGLDELTQLDFSYAHCILRIFINDPVNYKYYV